MLKPARIPSQDRRAVIPPMDPDRRCPFDLGEFTGSGLRRARARQTGAIAAVSALALLGAVTVAAHVIATRPECRVAVVSETGDEYLVGRGGTLAEAMHGAVLPADPHIYVLDGCDR